MGVPTSEIGYISATTRRRDHEVHKGHVVALGGKNCDGVKKGHGILNKGFRKATDQEIKDKVRRITSRTKEGKSNKKVRVQQRKQQKSVSQVL
jgi:hypothetical protein